MAIQSTPYALQNASHSAALFRQAMSGMYANGGILGPGELTVTQQGTPNMSIILGPGRSKVEGSQVSAPSGLNFTTQAMYDVLNDASLTLTVSTSDPSNPRIDAVYEAVQDAFYSGSNNQAIAAIATGTPNASPVAPTLPANSILVAYIAVGAGVTSIVNANITMQTQQASLIGSVPIVSSAMQASNAFGGSTHVQQGNLCFRSDQGSLQQWYNAYNTTTNPGGANVAGWYPIAGKLPRGRVYWPNAGIVSIGNNQFCFASAYVQAPANDSLWMMTYTQATGRFVCAVPGRFAVRVHGSGYASSSTIGEFAVTVNSTTAPTGNPAGDLANLNGIQDLVYQEYPMGGGYSNPIQLQMDAATAAATDFMQVWFGVATGFSPLNFASQPSFAPHLYYIEIDYVAPPTPQT